MSLFRRRRTRDDVKDDVTSSSPQSFTPTAPYAGMPALHPDSADPTPPVASPSNRADARVGESAASPWQPVKDSQSGGAAAPHDDPAAGSEAVLVRDPAAREGVDDPKIDPSRPMGVEDPIPQIAPVSRSGRNMPVAAAMGFLLLGVVVAAAWWNPLAFAVLMCVACVAAVMEWRQALASASRRIPVTPIALATVGMVVAAWYGGPEGLVVALMVGAAGTVAWRVVDERIENTLAESLAAMMTLLWIPFLAAFLVLMVAAPDGWQRVVVVVLAVAGSDTGGLFSGILFGKHPMAPRVSPKKTWEGFAGGLVLGVAVASIGSYFFFDGKWWIGAIVGVACVIAGVFGDLAESALKRDLRVKDMSSVLPGHGGVLDRIDSMLFAAPVAYVVYGLLLGAS